MNREIKFRAWDSLEKAMYQNVQKTEFYSFLCGQDFKVMQYTGLKDKNGKEIFEGDIVFDGRERLEVRWEVFEGFWKAVWGSGVIMGNPAMLEIIGNIYENNDLLK